MDSAPFCGSMDSEAEISLISKSGWEDFTRLVEKRKSCNKVTNIRATGDYKEHASANYLKLIKS